MKDSMRQRLRVAELWLVRAAPFAVVFVGFALLAWWLGDRRLTLEYLRTLVWPLVVSVVLWWIREPLRAKIADLLEVSGMGATAKFAEQRANAELESDLAEATSLLVSDQPDTAAVEDEEESPTPEEMTGQDALPLPNAPQPKRATILDSAEFAQIAADQGRRQREREQARRAAMETVITESAAWGYDMGKIGFKGRPVPVIEWDADGKPRIQYARGQRPEELAAEAHRAEIADSVLLRQPVVRDRRDAVTKIEDDIKRIEREMSNPFKIAAITDPALAFELDRAKRRLRKLDPRSPYLD